jgi:hypothetical protein
MTSPRLTPQFQPPEPHCDRSVPLGTEGDPGVHAVGPTAGEARPVWLLEVDGVLNANV